MITGRCRIAIGGDPIKMCLLVRSRAIGARCVIPMSGAHTTKPEFISEVVKDEN